MSGVIPRATHCRLNKKGANSRVFCPWIDLGLILLCAVLAGLTFFSHLGNIPLFNPDEGLYAEPAREMLDTGQYITTLLNYTVRFTKPPLIIWAMALSYKIFGVNEFAARFFCASSGFLLTLVAYLFAWKYLGRGTAIIAACILITAPLFVGVGHMAITDMPLSFFIAGCLFSFFHAWQQKKRFWLWAGYVLAGLAVMTKGPVGVILPGLILTSYFILCTYGKGVMSFLHIRLGSLVVAAIALPWFVIEIAITHGAYFREFILRENLARFTSVVDAHKGHWWYHLAAVFGGLFPWSIILPQAMGTIVRTIVGNTVVDNVQPAVRDFKPWLGQSKKIVLRTMESCRHLTLPNETLLFMLLWSVSTILFFSASVSKLLPYTLPAFPALAIIIAYQWQIFMQNNRSQGMAAYCAIIFCLFAGVGFSAPAAFKYLRNAPPDLASLLSLSASILSGFFLLALFFAVGKRRTLASFVLFGASIVFALIVTPKILSQVSQFWEGSVVDYARFAHHARQPLIIYRLRKPAMPFYFGARVFQASNKEELKVRLSLPGQCYLITNCKDIDFLQAVGCKIIAADGNFALLLSPDKRNGYSLIEN